MGKSIGIDLGTTNSCIAYLDKGQSIIIPNSNGKRVTPSIVAFTRNNQILVGESAKNQAITNSARTITCIKRKMGSFDSIKIDDKEYLPQEISSYILAKIKKDAQDYLNEKITDAVITVPAYFSDAQRQATIDAGKLAGLNVLRIINEPTASSLAYGLNTRENQKILVYDLGGGTFDVSILELEDGIFEVRATAGNNKLGGMDFDRRFLDLVIKQFKEKTGIDLSYDKLAIQKISEAVENAKIILSSKTEVEINIPFISADKNGPKHLQFKISRLEFELMIEDLINETIELTAKSLEQSGIAKDEIDKMIMVGGSTRIPYVIKKMEDFMGIEAYRGINPDEVVAMGAAIQAGIIKGEISGIVLVDVTPLSLGIEIDGGIFVPIIEKNSSIPIGAKKIFTTIIDNQDEVEIHILQGESRNVKDNISLGKFILSGIRRASKGEPRIEVSFDVDVDSIVHVKARDFDTDITQKITVNSRIGLSEEEINILCEQQKEFGSKNDSVDLINEARDIIFRLENILSEEKADYRNDIENVIIDLNKAIDDTDYENIKKYIGILKDFYEELLIMDKNTDYIEINDELVV